MSSVVGRFWKIKNIKKPNRPDLEKAQQRRKESKTLLMWAQAELKFTRAATTRNAQAQVPIVQKEWSALTNPFRAQLLV